MRSSCLQTVYNFGVESKESERIRLKSLRQKLTTVEVSQLSSQIINRCWQIIDWPSLRFIHSYLPIAKNNEVNVLPLLKAARQLKPTLEIAATIKGFDKQAHWLDANFKPTKKIPDNFQYGLVIVPMLGFDNDGYRLGYGGGYYDWFLADQQHARVIGLSFELGHLAKIPHEPHDIRLPIIVTEKTIYKF